MKQGKHTNGLNIISAYVIDTPDINAIVVPIVTERIKKYIIANAKAKFADLLIIELF